MKTKKRNPFTKLEVLKYDKCLNWLCLKLQKFQIIAFGKSILVN